MHRLTRTATGLVAAVAVVGLIGCRAGSSTSPRRKPTSSSHLARRVAPAPAAAPTPVAPEPPACVADPTLSQPTLPPSASLATALAQFLADARVTTRSVSLSVWIDGFGEVLTHEPDLALAPASNQKLFTAMSALATLGPETRLTTRLVAAPSGELVIVGGGDPTLTATGAHSLGALADAARAGGVTGATALLVDESHHDGARRAPGWQDWQIPTYTGPMSALMVADNRWRSDPAFVADPALANADLLREALVARGVTIAGPTAHTTGPTSGSTIAALESPTVAELVSEMLLRSDNQIADQLLKEIGTVGGGSGSAEQGAASGNAALAALCVPMTGHTDDGSGLSRADARSAREWRGLLQAARGAPWFAQFQAGLPVAARSGTLASRFGGTPAAANVRAKTGTIIGGAALSGYATTAGGRNVVFSVVVNGTNAEGAAGAIDRLVSSIVSDTN